MSRSYKKSPVNKDSVFAKEGKKSANRTVRRNAMTDTASGNAYKKEFESWDISETRSWQTEESFRKEWESKNGLVDRKNEKKYKADLFDWKKKYLRK